jgi:hypothetical protein
MWLKHKSLYWEVIIPFFTCFHELSFCTMGFFWWSENVLLMQHFRKTLLLDSTKIGSDTVCSSAWENRSDQSIPCFRKWLRILTKVQVVEHLEHLQWWLHLIISIWNHIPTPQLVSLGYLLEPTVLVHEIIHMHEMMNGKGCMLKLFCGVSWRWV